MSRSGVPLSSESRSAVGGSRPADHGVLGKDGKPLMVGEGEIAKTKTRIDVEDDEGRVIDLHALRTTLGTQLAAPG